MPAVVNQIAGDGQNANYTGSLTTFTEGSDVLVYDVYSVQGNNLRTIKYENSKWVDANTGDQPILMDSTFTTIITETATNPQYIYYTWYTNNDTFTNPYYTAASGPTVTSITVANTVSATREFTVTHTGTLTANDIGYKINGVDITTLTSPNTPITNLQTTSTGSTFDSYTLSSTGYHIINIGSQYLEFYKSVSLNAQTSFPELTNAGLSISFPSTQALWLAKAPGYDSLTLYNDGAQYKGTSQFNGYDRIEYLWIGTKYFTNSDPTLRGFKAYVNTYIDETATWNQGTVSYIDPVARYESTGLLTTNFYAGQTHVSNGGYYSFDFVSLLAQAQKNGGGKRRRYPIISTNLFDRQRSIYSIGNTHKDETLF